MPRQPNHRARIPLDDFVENDHPVHELPLMNVVCVHCGARKFKIEPKGFCCKTGKVQIALPPAFPLYLQHLYQQPQFKDKIRKYNQAFAFTSLGGTKVDYALANNQQGVYTFRVNGQFHHQIGTYLQPRAGETPKYFQIYFTDTAQQVVHRQNVFGDLNAAHLTYLTNLLQEENPYVQLYKRAMDSAEYTNADDFRLVFRHTGVDQRTHNSPTADEVGVIMADVEGGHTNRDIILRKTTGGLKRINELHVSSDPLSYPLLFPYGTGGWHPLLLQTDGVKTVSATQFYSYMLQLRPTVNPIHQGGRLLQQYVVDQYAKIEACNLDYLRRNQNKLRADTYQGVCDAVNNNNGNDVDGANVGRRIVLPSSFVGGPRYMQQLLQDALALCREFGKPDLFVTITCNPTWPEILRELSQGQTAQDVPHIVSRVFNAKLEALKKDILKDGYLGRAVAHCYTIEFQKRGLPHCHLLIFFAPHSKVVTPQEYDQIVSAELPDPVTQPELFQTVSNCMIHTCSPERCCNNDEGTCSKKYPKSFLETSESNDDGFPLYRRRNNGRSFIKRVNRRDVVVDNRSVIPYNPYLTRKYNCHINVEICCSVKSIKYIFKYVHKGHDRAAVDVVNNAVDNAVNPEEQVINEIDQYLEGRYVSASEACWRILSLKMHGISHAVTRLPIHLPDQQQVYFDDDADIDQVADEVPTSKLQAFFELCAVDDNANELTYTDLPKLYTWQARTKIWQTRNRGANQTIGRMYSVSVAEGERFYLRLLLTKVKGPTSFEDVRTYEGVVYPTFKEACVARGLLEDDTEWDQCMIDATASHMPWQLRNLFASIVYFCAPTDIGALWDKHFDALTEDYYDADHALKLAKAAKHIDNYFLRVGNKSWGDYPGLPIPDFQLLQQEAVNQLNHPQNDDDNVNDLIEEATNYNVEEQQAIFEETSQQLNQQQSEVYNRVMESVNNGEGVAYFLQGAGGTGKTFTYKPICARLRAERKIVLVVASSGIAAYLLEGGTTAHYRFKLPLNIESTSTCRIPVNGNLADLIRRCSLIIWDESPMMHRHCFEAFERTLRDICDGDFPFGGKVVLFGGDFRQIPPVIIRGSPVQITNASLKKSTLWRDIRVIELQHNMRLDQGGDEEEMQQQQEYAEFLLRVGEGREGTAVSQHEYKIPVPPAMVPQQATIEGLIDEIYPGVSQPQHDDYFVDRAILATKNSDVQIINDLVSEQFPGAGRQYLSADSITDAETGGVFPTEFLNTLSPNGIPPHELTIKLGMPIMLLRNLNPHLGLCNGTRLIVTRLRPHSIEAKVAVGKSKGLIVFLHRLNLSPASSTLPFDLVRRQFPIKPCFAMTINKSQGQTIDKLGVCLQSPAFSHGQLYVALSRVKNVNNIKVLAPDNIMTNIVYAGLLS